MKSLQVITLVIFTPVIVLDYFPNLSLVRVIPDGILLWLILVIYVISFSFKRFSDGNLREWLQWQVLSLFYLLSLLALLTILGGQSTAGIAFDSPFLWLILLMSCLDIYSRWKKLKQEQAAH
ncbi:hypothetical protein ACIQXR_14910 [Peribacillus sp. NPDC097224]|uniref:hypothetical protein n=1 Tax=Peribacillus sp. NPDC097224 TaxID=3364399 RepID=UPI0038083DE4